MKHDYSEYESLIRNKAFYYSQVYKFNYEDLLSEAQETFCIASRDYKKKSNSTFKAWLNFMLKTRLNSFIIKMCNTEIISTDFVTLLLENKYYNERNVIEYLWLQDRIGKLRRKSKKILYLILYPTDKQIRQSPHKLTRHSLKKYLRKHGWRDRTIKSCFKEIEEVLRDA